MNNDNKIQGIWWLSDNPDNVLSGDLLIDKRKLELNGSFEGFKTGPYGGGPKIISIQQNRTILGVSKIGGKKYTLEFFDEPSFSMSMPGYKSDTYLLGTILEGEHFPQTNNLSFDNYYIDFPYLFEWVNDGVISTQMQTSTKSIGSIIITVGKPKTIEVFQNNHLKLGFTISPGKVSLSSLKNIDISQKCLIKIEGVKSTLSLIDLYSMIAHLERFLIIAVGKRLNVTGFQAVLGKGKNSTVINIHSHFLEKREYSEVHPFNMSFTFQTIKSDSQAIFERWFADQEKHIDTFNLFSAIYSDSSKNLNNQFKDIVSAIEGYVRIEKGNLDISLDLALKILNEEIPKNDRPISNDERKRIRITRNKLSHIAIKSDDEQYVLNDEEKWINFHKLLFVLEYSLLKKLGLREDLLYKFYQKKKVWN